MTGDREAANDLAQEALVAAWRHLPEFRGDAKFESWLYRIATNRTLNFLQSRKKGAAGELTDHIAAPGAGPDVEAHRSELREGVLEFMSTLPPRQRLVFDLRFYQDMTFPEIAETIGQALGSVKTHYREAVKKLRVFAAGRGWDQ
jgi:RNA polymerase sigma-70 factor (ECF subfamily)